MHYNHRYNSEHNTKAKEFLLSQLKPRFSETNSPSRIKSKPVTVIIMDIILGSLCVCDMCVRAALCHVLVVKVSLL